MSGEVIRKLLLVLLLAVTVTAQPAMAVEKLELGFGLGAAPDYEGSEDYKPVFIREISKFSKCSYHLPGGTPWRFSCAGRIAAPGPPPIDPWRTWNDPVLG